MNARRFYYCFAFTYRYSYRVAAGVKRLRAGGNEIQ